MFFNICNFDICHETNTNTTNTNTKIAGQSTSCSPESRVPGKGPNLEEEQDARIGIGIFFHILYCTSINIIFIKIALETHLEEEEDAGEHDHRVGKEVVRPVINIYLSFLFLSFLCDHFFMDHFFVISL